MPEDNTTFADRLNRTKEKMGELSKKAGEATKKATQATGDFLEKTSNQIQTAVEDTKSKICLLYTSPSPRDQRGSRMPSSA